MNSSAVVTDEQSKDLDKKYSRWIKQAIIALCVSAMFSLFGAFQYAFEIASASFPYQKIFSIMMLLGMALAASRRILFFSVLLVLFYGVSIYYYWDTKDLNLDMLINPQGEKPIGHWMYLSIELTFMFFFVRSMIAHFYFESQRD